MPSGNVISSDTPNPAPVSGYENEMTYTGGGQVWVPNPGSSGGDSGTLYDNPRSEPATPATSDCEWVNNLYRSGGG